MKKMQVAALPSIIYLYDIKPFHRIFDPKDSETLCSKLNVTFWYFCLKVPSSKVQFF